MKDDIKKLEKELNEVRKELKILKDNENLLRKAIWDMLNYANMFVVILDSRMIIKLINYSLSISLGFKDEIEPIGRCWLDFIPDDSKNLIKIAHNKLVFNRDVKNYREVINEIIGIDNKINLVKWFNIPINSIYNLTLSFGLSLDNKPEVTEESIRSYYTNIIEKDKTMIQSLRDSLTINLN